MYYLKNIDDYRSAGKYDTDDGWIIVPSAAGLLSNAMPAVELFEVRDHTGGFWDEKKLHWLTVLGCSRVHFPSCVVS